MNVSSKIALALAATAIVSTHGTAEAVTIDFNSLAHGQYVPNGTTFGPATVHFYKPTTNFTDGIQSSEHAVGGGFDSNFSGSTSDEDLIFDGGWRGGNIKTQALGSMLYLEENPGDSNHDGRDDDPDDRADGGYIAILFNEQVSTFGFDFIDIESSVKDSSRITALSNGSAVGTSLSFADLQTRDTTIAFGDGYANRVMPIRADEFLTGSFNGVLIRLGGSGAIDTINVEFSSVPEPGTIALLGSGMFAYGVRRRRKAESGTV